MCRSSDEPSSLHSIYDTIPSAYVQLLGDSGNTLGGSRRLDVLAITSATILSSLRTGVSHDRPINQGLLRTCAASRRAWRRPARVGTDLTRPESRETTWRRTRSLRCRSPRSAHHTLPAL